MSIPLNDKIVLVTGAAGFLGSHIVEALLAEGARVVAMDIKEPYESKIPVDVRMNPRFVYVTKDITNIGDVTEVFLRYRPDMVCHQAALISVPESVARPEEYMRVNEQGTMNVFSVAYRCGVKKIVTASSAAIYGGISPYAVSKAMNEKLADMFNKNYGMSILVLRYFNVYGPRQAATIGGAVIPSFIKQVLTQDKVAIYGDGEAVRDFVFVRDVAAANVAALKYEGTHQSFDIGTGIKTTINELLQDVMVMLNKSIPVERTEDRAGDQRISIAVGVDIAKDEMGWEPKFTMTKGLAITGAAYAKEFINA